MRQEEGIRRLRVTARTVVMIGTGLIALCAAVSLVSVILSAEMRGADPFLSTFFLVGLYLTALGGLLWAGVWIAEGLVRGPDVPQQ